MSKSSIIELQTSTMANGGQALGRHEGQIIFVPGAIPGETVRARIVQAHKRWSLAELVSVLQPSPHRIEPPCPYYGRCGGCHFQHIDYEAQLDYKRLVVIEQLQRLGHIEDPEVAPTIGMAEPWFWRNHAQFSVNESGRLGFQSIRSHDVVPIDQCLLLHPLLDELHEALDLDWPELKRLSLRAGIRTGERMCIFETKDDSAPELEVDFPISCVFWPSSGADVILVGHGSYHEMLRGKTFRVSAQSFFQVNTEQAEVMLDVIEQFIEPEGQDTLLDVYCGVGALSLTMQDQVGRIIGIEENPSAVQDAIVNANMYTGPDPDSNENLTFIQASAEEILPELDERITKMILDPPRKGCKPEALNQMIRLAPSHIVYVSCDPTTLARDAVQLCKNGYELIQVQPVDMFPQTFHIETVSLWRK
ncbi:MAG: 23S rRNA (uracil(1939)-C(5))-methyltransferase RlmD [Anaerolineae bacterium]|nr:23S rRNA (uracil(1939)-C(5))-methyltransferase RlmD [Anaerolineae bacterium]